MAPRYLLFQLPEWTAVAAAAVVGVWWLEAPSWIAVAITLSFLLKDVLLFPVLWRAYSTEPSDLVGEGNLLGASGMALAELAPSGYIRVGSELWRAELEEGEPPVPRGSRVCISGIRGLTVRVRGERHST